MVIYKITNNFDDKIYIGQTVQELHKRWIQHKCDAKTRAGDSVLRKAMSKYGVENFKIQIMVRCNTMEELNYREEYYIRLFSCLAPHGYNLSFGGGNKRHTLSSRKKISDKKIGIKTGRTWNKGISPSRETRMKISAKSKGAGNGMFGKTHSLEARNSISKAQMGRKKTVKEREATAIKTRKPVLCHQLGLVFISVAEAALYCNITSQSVSQVALGQRKQCKGFTFSYVEIDKTILSKSSQ